jgi:threonine/homoserine/homoserine lactone efflux protein
MNAHAAVPAHPHRSAWSIPLLLSVALGAYAAFLEHTSGSSAVKAAVVGLVAGAVTAVVCFAVGRARSAMGRELRAATYGAVFGSAMGFLLSLSGWTVLKASLVGMSLGLGMLAIAFYVFYTREG